MSKTSKDNEKKYYSFEEYLALEEEAEHRHEYYNGEVIAMAGGTVNHNLIVLNLASIFKGHLRGARCRVFAENVKLDLNNRENCVYPDVMVTCSEEDLLNTLIMKFPSVLIEVLSDSTALIDLNVKLNAYLKLPSLRYYLLVNQYKYQVNIYEKREEEWAFNSVEGVDNLVWLSQFDLTIPMSDIYEDVQL